MKAVRLIEVGQPLELQEIPVPSLGEKDILVRVKAAGICHSDAHYRAGKSPVYPLPMTLGHEIAGLVEEVGSGVSRVKRGDRVVLHYLVTCGDCHHCTSGNEQFCSQGLMLGHFTDGGYAEYIVVPERNAVRLAEEIPYEPGATLMCASATSFHALRKSRLKPTETAAVFGIGGLGVSAVQLARVFGALDVFGVDINPVKLSLAEFYGAIPINANETDPAAAIRDLTGGRGVDVALDLVGVQSTMEGAVKCLAPLGRAVIVGIADKPLSVDTYRDLLGKEVEIIGSSDHLLHELPVVVELARRGALDLSQIVTRTVPLDAVAINETLDALDKFSDAVRTVIVPHS
jgi:2-desacetyl-2-hydroxyethyl bacteriochlorophyllide A dehydrogenase